MRKGGISSPVSRQKRSGSEVPMIGKDSPGDRHRRTLLGQARTVSVQVSLSCGPVSVGEMHSVGPAYAAGVHLARAPAVALGEDHNRSKPAGGSLSRRLNW